MLWSPLTRSGGLILTLWLTIWKSEASISPRRAFGKINLFHLSDLSEATRPRLAHPHTSLKNTSKKINSCSPPPCIAHFFSICIAKSKKKTSNDQPYRHQAVIARRHSKHLKMPAVWDDARERDLLEEIYFVLSSRQPLSQEDKDAVAAGMKQRGYQNITWNAIR